MTFIYLLAVLGISLMLSSFAAATPIDLSVLRGNYGMPSKLVPAPADARFAHLSWPKIVRATDGTLVLAYIAGRFHGPDGEGCPAVSISTDGGATFSAPIILREYGAHDRYTSAGNVALGLAEDGAVVLLTMTYAGNIRSTVAGWRSTDNGTSWQDIDTATLADNRTGSVFGHVFTVPGNGLAVCGHYRAGSQPTEGMWIAYSSDNGRHWGVPRCLSTESLYEPAVLYSAGRLIGLVRAGTGADTFYWQAVSDDLGATWHFTKAALTPSGADPVRMPSPCIVADRTDPQRLFALQTERATGKSTLPGAITLWTADARTLAWRRLGIVARFPSELGVNNDFGYPWITQLDDHTWQVVWYCGQMHGPNALYGLKLDMRAALK
jgi:hypothetical protein